MNIIFGSVLSLVFIVIASIHFYWGFGGENGLDKALPTDKKGNRVLNPGKIETFIVGFGILLFAFYYLLKIGLVRIELPEWIINYSGWIISLIFILRAIGEFKYVGFFKKNKDTEFGKFDTKYYSPLCLIIGLIGIIVEIFK